MLMAGCSWPTAAQRTGVTTGSMQGLVSNEAGPARLAGASVIAIHIPLGHPRKRGRTTRSGTAVLRRHGEWRAYSVTVTFAGTGGTAFEPRSREQPRDGAWNSRGLDGPRRSGAARICRPGDDRFIPRKSWIPVFSSTGPCPTGAEPRGKIAALPTVSNRSALRPAAAASALSFAGVDNRS